MNKDKKEFTAQGFLTTCNFGGIEIEIYPSNESLRWRFNFGEDDPDLNNEIHEAEIVYEPNEDNPAGDFVAGFFIKANEDEATFYPISDFMRIQ